MGMLVKLERSVRGLSVDFGNHLSALISGADGEYEYINAKFSLRDLEDPESGRRYDSPVARYEDPCLGPLLMQLDGQKGVECPALYVFRLSDTSVPMGFNQSWLEEMRGVLEGLGRKMPPVNKGVGIVPGAVLYVGMRQSGLIGIRRKKLADGLIQEPKMLSAICSRIITHLGYTREEASQSGLQLVHWRKHFPSLTIELKIHFLSPGIKDFVVMYEKMYALQNPPILGKHK